MPLMIEKCIKIKQKLIYLYTPKRLVTNLGQKLTKITKSSLFIHTTQCLTLDKIGQLNQKHSLDVEHWYNIFHIPFRNIIWRVISTPHTKCTLLCAVSPYQQIDGKYGNFGYCSPKFVRPFVVWSGVLMVNVNVCVCICVRESLSPFSLFRWLISSLLLLAAFQESHSTRSQCGYFELILLKRECSFLLLSHAHEFDFTREEVRPGGIRFLVALSIFHTEGKNKCCIELLKTTV